MILVTGGFTDIAAQREAAGHADDPDEHTMSRLSAHEIGFVEAHTTR